MVTYAKRGTEPGGLRPTPGAHEQRRAAGTSGRGTTGTAGGSALRETSGQGTAGEPAGSSAPRRTPSWPTPQKNSEAPVPRETAAPRPHSERPTGPPPPRRAGPAPQALRRRLRAGPAPEALLSGPRGGPPRGATRTAPPPEIPRRTRQARQARRKRSPEARWIRAPPKAWAAWLKVMPSGVGGGRSSCGTLPRRGSCGIGCSRGGPRRHGCDTPCGCARSVGRRWATPDAYRPVHSTTERHWWGVRVGTGQALRHGALLGVRSR